MDFLGHILSWEGVKPNLKKLEAIQDWKRLVTVKGIRSFLGLLIFTRSL
jgi:type III secretory pathway component EscU